MSRKVRKYFSFTAFVLPAFLFYFSLSLLPTMQGLFYSFTNWHFMNPKYGFVGLQNFINIFTKDRYFVMALKNTFKLVAALVILQPLIALLLALMIEACAKWLQKIFRTVIFVPYMISTIVGTFMWSFVFRQVFTQIGSSIPLLGFLNQSWLSNVDLAFWSIIIVSLWHGTPLLMVIFLAGLAGVPVQLKEAAVIDGAKPSQVFWHIKLPLIFYSLTICMFLTIKDAFKSYEIVYALTGGGPGWATQVMTLNIFEEAFSGNYMFGYASAKAVVFLLIVLVFTVAQLLLMKRREVEL
ncbi:MAG: sugar ABC transporter permease [Eubacteriales bacterium]|nr:sugar ABC transporter permease [Eubacteriales bacterium]